jgi:hypothetical protein
LVAAAEAGLARLSPEALSEAVAHPLSSSEISRLVGPEATVTTYDRAFGSDLRSDLAKSPGRAVVFLWRSEPAYGHWMAAFEGSSHTPYIFDSYGKREPDSWARGSGAAALGQAEPLLLQGLLESDYPRLHWSEWPLQILSPEVQTCGRWAAVRIALRDLGVKDFASASRAAAREIGVSPDEMVTAVTQAAL